MRQLLVMGLLVGALTLTACGRGAPAAVAEPVATTAGEPVAPGELPLVDPMTVTGDIVTAGSSTVYPLTEAIAEQFIDEGYADAITIDSIGTGAGFERFCVAGEIDIANASRAIKDSERESCLAIGREPLEFRVGVDALAIVVNPENNWLTNGVTKDQLALLFSDQAVNWSDVDPAWPAEPIERFAPGTDSGTFDYFIDAVMKPRFVVDADKTRGEVAFLKAANLQQSEDDNVLVQGVEGDKYAIGFIGFAFFAENEELLKAVAVEGVEPEVATIRDGSYPLARPLFIYSAADVIAQKPQVGAFINYYLTSVDDLIRGVGYFPAPDDALDAAQAALLKALEQASVRSD